MAGKKRTAQPLSPNSGSNASASFLMARENGSSKATRAKPLAMNEEQHTGFLPVYIHTAKCDICEKRNGSVLQRCVTCTSQFCRSCMQGGDGIHAMSHDMDWTDYGAQASSTFKAQKKAQKKAQDKSSFATEIPSCRYHQKEYKIAGRTTEVFIVDEISTKAGPATKRQKTTSDQQPSSKTLISVAKKDTRAVNATSNHTEAKFPLITPGHKDDYRPRVQKVISNVTVSHTDHDMTEDESDPSGNDNHHTSPFRVLGRKRSSGKPAPTPWAKEIKEHKQDITAELALIDRQLDLLNDKKRLALVRKMHIDEALNGACILMTMRTDARGFPAETETSTLAPTGKTLIRGRDNEKSLDAAHNLTSMQKDTIGIPAQTEASAMTSKYLTRVHENDKSLGVARTSASMGTDARGIPADPE